MFVQQISVFVENKPGRMTKIAGILADKHVNLQAMSIADTSDFGILRLIVNRPQEAFEALKEAGLIVRMTDVIAVPLTHSPGSLAEVMKVLDANGIGIEYMYAFTAQVSTEALAILCTDEPERTLEALKKGNIEVLPREVVYGIA